MQCFELTVVKYWRQWIEWNHRAQLVILHIQMCSKCRSAHTQTPSTAMQTPAKSTKMCNVLSLQWSNIDDNELSETTVHNSSFCIFRCAPNVDMHILKLHRQQFKHRRNQLKCAMFWAYSGQILTTMNWVKPPCTTLHSAYSDVLQM